MSDILRRRGAALDPGGKTRMADKPREWKPVADILESATEYVVRINMPGLRREQISVVLPDERTLVVRGTYGADSMIEEATYLLAERPKVPVERLLRLPAPVLVEEVAATLDSGVLTIRLRKRAFPDPGPRQIVIG
ncbi:MAG: Hsp20/alpha crystallin family protein [Candidatus Sumerlaeia bacterium]|nr:Hsp20/alpha crystallin family protein [Candidatus Sumerlaeia bacterium]